MPGIRLHKTKGVNPHLTVCTNCGKDTNEIVLLGMRDNLYRCKSCGVNIFGGGATDVCPACNERGMTFVREIGEHERLPSGLCDECTANRKAQEEMVAAGGIYFQCADCHAEGTIRAGHPLAVYVRERMGKPAPAAVGAEIDKSICPNCGEHAAAGEAAAVENDALEATEASMAAGGTNAVPGSEGGSGAPTASGGAS